MNTDEILDQLFETRERLLVALEMVPEEMMLRPVIMGDWSIKDLLAHLIVWESELVTALMQIKQGKTPHKMLAAFENVDGYNAAQHALHKERDLDLIFDDLQGVRMQLEQWLEEYSDRELTDTKRYKWSKGLPLWHIIKENSFGHEAEHLPEIEAYARQYGDETE